MLCWRSGRRSAGQAESRQNADRGRRPRRLPGHRSNSHAPDSRCLIRHSYCLYRRLGGSLQRKSFSHQITYLKGKPEAASELLPRVHLVISLLKRWLLGTHQGAVSHKYLDDYLNEFVFALIDVNLPHAETFYRLAQQTVI